MTTQQVADRYYELIQQYKHEQILNELYAPGIVSLEPVNDTHLPDRVEGLEAYRAKEALFYRQVEEMHGSYMAPPIVATYHFAMMSGMDVTMKGKERMKKDQIGVFQVRDGKIFREQWFYNDFD